MEEKLRKIMDDTTEVMKQLEDIIVYMTVIRDNHEESCKQIKSFANIQTKLIQCILNDEHRIHDEIDNMILDSIHKK